MHALRETTKLVLLGIVILFLVKISVDLSIIVYQLGG